MEDNTQLMPEPSWLWRRVLTFSTSAVIGLIVAYAAYALAQAEATASLLTLALALVVQNTALQLVYIVAPSAEYVSCIAELVKAARSNA